MKPKPKKTDHIAGDGKVISPIKRWVCIDMETQSYLLKTIGLTKKNCVSNTERIYQFTWDKFKKQGYRIVRVRVEVV